MHRILGVAIAVAAFANAGCGECDVFTETGCFSGRAMHDDVAWLASPALQGRRAGTPENAKVVDEVVERFERVGLAPAGGGYRQSFPFVDWIPGEAQPRVTLANKALSLGEDFEPLWFSGSGSATDLEVVFVGYGLEVPPFDPAEYPDCPVDPAGYSDFDGVDLDGKVALVLRGYPADDRALLACPNDPFCTSEDEYGCFSQDYTASKIQRAGAVAKIEAGPYWGMRDIRPFVSTGMATAVPSVMISHVALEAALPNLPRWAEQIDTQRRPASRATGVTASISVDGETHGKEAENVLGVLRGADPSLRDEVVVIGAHLDHEGALAFRDTFYPGADDNASGTAVLLALARAAAESPTPPARTLLFAAWNAEELGLYGSCYQALYDPAFPLDRTVAAFSIDMVGAGTPGLELWGAEDTPEIFGAAQKEADARGLEWPLLAKEPLYASDHYCYAYAGVPALLASTPVIDDHPYYHSTRDTADTVSPENLEAAAELVWAALRPLADGSVGTAPANALRAETLPPPETLREAWDPADPHGRRRRDR